MARPTKFKEEYKDQLRKMATFGLTDAQMSDVIGVTEQTLNNWKKSKPEFFESLKAGKEFADRRVERALYERAIGYSHPEDKVFNNSGKKLVVPTIKHYPPDPTSCIYWLNNRDSENWRNKTVVDVKDNEGLIRKYFESMNPDKK